MRTTLLFCLVAGCQAAGIPLEEGDLAGPPAQDLAAPRDGGALTDAPIATLDIITSASDLAKPSGVSGAPCTSAADCTAGLGPNQEPFCATVTGTGMNQLTWPGGYCTTPCRTSRTDPMSGLNSDCPGGNGTCGGGQGALGNCFALCPDFNGAIDCRTGYACFVINNYALACYPRSASECDPMQPGSCKPDAQGNPQTCDDDGDGTVGVCLRACDPFTGTGCDQNDPFKQTACHVSLETGEGLCVQPGTQMKCMTEWDCGSAMGCNATGVCAAYCDDANAVQQCGNNAKCRPIPGVNLPTKTIGVCGP